MNIWKKLGLTKRKYKLRTLFSGSICKFLAKRYAFFWAFTLLSFFAFLVLADSASESWIIVMLLYILFVPSYTITVILQNREIGDVCERIEMISEKNYEEFDIDENSLCIKELKALSEISAELNRLTEANSAFEKENAELHAAVGALTTRVERLCDGDFDPCDYEESSIIAASLEKLNTLGKVVSHNIESQIAAERTKVELVTNVSHDLKTPLTSIIGYVDLLSKIEDLPDEARDYVEIISRKSECLSHTVYDLFDIAKASAMQDIELEEIDGVMLLKQVLADMQDKLDCSDTPVRETYSDSACKIISNGKKLYRVFQNLLDNALKYSLSGSRIYIRQYTTPKEFVVEINNTASYEMTFDADEISERFVRGDKSRTDEESNGLGLSIVSTFTRALGGSFSVNIDCDRFIATVKIPRIRTQ